MNKKDVRRLLLEKAGLQDTVSKIDHSSPAILPPNYEVERKKCEEIRKVLLQGNNECGLVMRRRFLHSGDCYLYEIQCACGVVCGGWSPREAEKNFNIHLGEKVGGKKGA